MRTIIKISFLLFFLLVVISCSQQEVIEDFPYGSYSLNSYDIIGSIIGNGSIQIQHDDSTNVSGTWVIKNIRNCKNCGPMFGGGFLEGTIENGTLHIRLNPNYLYNDVELTGEFGDSTFFGEWYWTNDNLIVNHGTFKAKKL